jgi:uncharacterized protein YgbK (DUF1537 family)
VITVVLDDDPTGTQAMSGVSVVLDWSGPEAWNCVEPGDCAVHVLTNSRAHAPEDAGRLVASAAAAAREQYPDARLVLRGDSTLRAHVWEEYEALRAIVAPQREGVPLLLVPALPAAGRVTIDGVHLLERDGERVRVDATEYARDGALSYSDSTLRCWADERSGGRLAAAGALELPLARLRGRAGSAELAAALGAAAERARPLAVIPDAVSDDDLRTIASGLRAAEEAGSTVIVRCSPAFVVALTGSAPRAASAPSGERGVLVVCGSFVPASTAQLERLAHVYPGASVSAHVAALAGDAAEEEIARLALAARERLGSGGLAVVATERERDPALVDAAGQRRVASALAQVARRVPAGVVIAKGGITSAVTAREGLGARAARVVGPIATGVVLWRLSTGTDYVVVPGNVGGPDLLADVVAAVAPRSPGRAEARC